MSPSSPGRDQKPKGEAPEPGSSRNTAPLCPSQSFPLASSHLPPALRPPTPGTDSRGRDSSRQSLKRCRCTGRVFSFLRSPGEALNSRAVSSPLFTSQRDCEMSGNISRAGGDRAGGVTDRTSERLPLSPALLATPLPHKVPRGQSPLPRPPSCSSPIHVDGLSELPNYH